MERARSVGSDLENSNQQMSALIEAMGDITSSSTACDLVGTLVNLHHRVAYIVFHASDGFQQGIKVAYIQSLRPLKILRSRPISLH